MGRWLFVSSCVLGLVACAEPEVGSASGTSDLSAAAVGDCAEVDEEEVEHACLHGMAGPFRSVTASDSAPPDVSRPHTTYRVQLEALGSGQFGGALSFLPEEAGEYAIYTSADVPEIELTHGLEIIPYECSTPVPTTLCGMLRRLRVADLEAGTPVVLSLAPSEASSFMLVIEHREHAHDEDAHDEHDHDDHDHDD